MGTYGIDCNKKSLDHDFPADPPEIETPPPFLGSFQPFSLASYAPSFPDGQKANAG
jgi:hypothetical protein